MNALAPQGQTKPLQRQPTDDLTRPLFILFSAYPDFSKTPQEAEARTAAYLLALSTFPEWAVRQAVTRFVQGHVERRNRDKIPTAEQIAAEAREIVNDEAEKRRQQNIIDQQRKEREAEEKRRANRGSQEERGRKIAEIMARYMPKTMQE